MKISGKFKILFLFAAVLIGSAPALASQPEFIGSFGKWDAYSFQESSGKVCYMIAVPESSKGNYTSRGDIYAIITHRPGEGARNVFSYITGYNYKDASNATVKIDSTNFLLFTRGDKAWAPDAKTDDQIADAIRKGARMVVTGTSSRGTLTTDTFNLSGTSAAYVAMSKACNVAVR